MSFIELVKHVIDFVLHMDHYLAQIVTATHGWTYLILFAVIFIETGVVILPFLPGDSLLFMAGALAASTGVLNPLLLWVLMAGAAILGDTVNYWIGHKIGPAAFSGKIRWLKIEYLERTQAFYEKHGGKTIFLARFVPIVRTFAPFVAGVGKMRYTYFLSYNVFGGIIWTGLFTFGGYFFGNLEFVQNNFSLVVIAIIVISVLPAVWEVIKERRKPAPAVKAEQKPLD
jgi:membrane-associated protein